MAEGKDTDLEVSPTEPTEPTEPAEPTEPTEPTEPQEPTKPFNKEQEQYIGSWLGRIVANQLEEKVMPHLNKASDTSIQNIPEAGSDAISKFNEKLQEKIFSGDVMGAFKMYQDVQTQAQANLSKSQKTETDKLITNLSEKPYYKDIFKDVQNIAHDSVGKGIPPHIAVDLAYARAKSDHLEKVVGGGTGADTDNLGMLGGGKASPKDKGVGLPPEMKAAAQRDIADSLYKNEKEWAENLDPKLRKLYGLDK